jgi:hypothetical protein
MTEDDEDDDSDITSTWPLSTMVYPDDTVKCVNC